MNKESSESILGQSWQKWKEICSIMGCPEPERTSLEKRVGRAFNKRLSSFIRENNPVPEVDMETAAQAFDVGVIEKVPHAGHAKTYKDYIWYLIAQNPDEPPLRIINGKLLGKEGLINDIVLSYLQKDTGVALRICRNGKGTRYALIGECLDAPISTDGEDSKTRLDRLAESEISIVDTYLSYRNGRLEVSFWWQRFAEWWK